MMKTIIVQVILASLTSLFSCGTQNNGNVNNNGIDSVNTASNKDIVNKDTSINDCDAILANVIQQSAGIAKTHKATDTKIGKRSKSAYDPSGFVLVCDIIPDVVMETRYYTSYNFVGKQIDGYKEPVAICSREAAYALKKVADNLRNKGYLIKIYDAYRPQKAVDHFCRWAQSNDTTMKAVFFPQQKKSTLFPTYIARKSGHSKGSTFDLTIIDAKTKVDADMGSPFDFFGERSHYDYSKITDAHKTNRKLLHDAMTAGGFRAYSNEWWHFTLKNEPYPTIYFTFDNDSQLIK